MSHQKTDTANTVDGHRPIFRFTYRSIPFCVLPPLDSADTDGMLEAVVGIIPFTVDGVSLRSNMLAVIDEIRRIPGYRVQIGADHVINLSVPLSVQGEVSAAAILASAIEQLAAAKRCLDRVLSLQPPHLQKLIQAQSQSAA